MDETKEDAKSLLALHTKFGKPYILNTLLPLVRKSTNLTFVETLTLNIFDDVKTGSINVEKATRFCDDMYGALINSIRQSCPYINADWRNTERLREDDASEKLTWPDDVFNRREKLYEYGVLSSKPASYLLADKLLKILEFCEDHGLVSAVGAMLDLLEDMAKTGQEVAFEKYHFPLLEALPPSTIKTEEARYQRQFRSIINSYITRFLGEPPKEPKDWSRPKVGCSGKKYAERVDCQDCRDLDMFLLGPSQPIMYFKAAEPRRKHLERELPFGEYETYTE